MTEFYRAAPALSRGAERPRPDTFSVRYATCARNTFLPILRRTVLGHVLSSNNGSKSGPRMSSPPTTIGTIQCPKAHWFTSRNWRESASSPARNPPFNALSPGA